MADEKVPRVVPPRSGPQLQNLTEIEEFQDLISASLPDVRQSAQAWRNGVAGMITLVTTGLLIKGRDVTVALPYSWRLAVTVSFGVGIAILIFSLWQVLSVEAGSQTRLQTLADIHSQYASVQAYKVGLASAGGRRLHKARYGVAIALSVLFLGVVLTWWAPSPAAYLSVNYDGHVACGIPVSSDGDSLIIALNSSSYQLRVPLKAMRELKVVGNC